MFWWMLQAIPAGGMVWCTYAAITSDVRLIRTLPYLAFLWLVLRAAQLYERARWPEEK